MYAVALYADLSLSHPNADANSRSNASYSISPSRQHTERRHAERESLDDGFWAMLADAPIAKSIVIKVARSEDPQTFLQAIEEPVMRRLSLPGPPFALILLPSLSLKPRVKYVNLTP